MSGRLLLLSSLAVAGAGAGVIGAIYATRSSSNSTRVSDAGPATRRGFRVELVYAPALANEGSWVSLTVDGRGRLIASDQYGLLYRVTPAPLGGDAGQSRCEPIRVGVGAAQGMTFVNDALYVMVNAPGDAISSGLYRVTDTNGDDRFDQAEELAPLRGSGEHGPHAVIASPDGKSLYFCAGNYTRSPVFRKSRVPAGWGEDQLLPRLDDPAGQANGVPAPGGWIVQCDLNGQQCELMSVGYRNIYDMAFNEDGELFTCDSDLDVDIGVPWYRPPAVLHVTSGADYGWRGGDGIWPSYYPDTLPPAVRLAPGSPTGMVSGAGTKFPRSYQQAMFVGDWSRGTIYAVHLSPVGASYHGQCEPLATGVGGVTDLIVSPTDGALYFTVGGRQTQGGLYRIVWDGPSASAAGAAADGAAVADDTAAKARAARRALEELHGERPSGAESPAWAGLSSPDRFIRYAALTALERVDASSWQDRALGETDLLARFTALMALARRDQPAQPHKWVGAIAAVEFHKLSEQEQQTVVRATSLGVMRFRNLDSALRKRLATTVSEWRPTQRRAVDRELAKLLVRLESADIVPALVAELHAAAASEAAIDAAVTLSAARAGWSTESRSALLDWFDEAAKRYGGRSFYPYLVAARARFVAGFDALERVQFAERLAPPVRPEDDSDFETPRKFVKRWTANEVVRVVERSEQESPAGESAALDGRRVFLALGCADCHAVAGEGSSVGPDLTNVGRRYSVADLARAITQPSDEVPDLYRQTTFVSGGRAITGRPTNMTSTTISVTTDMRDPASAVKLQRDEIESQSLSPTSAMPSNLLDTLTADEVAALFAYLREPSRETAGGRPSATID